MLVYHKLPMGLVTIDGQRIAGKYYNYGRLGGPFQISRKKYLAHRNILEEVPVDTEWLNKRFGGEFPPLSFKYSGLTALDYPTLVQIARLMGINYIEGRSKQGSKFKRSGLLSAIHAKLEQKEE